MEILNKLPFTERLKQQESKVYTKIKEREELDLSERSCLNKLEQKQQSGDINLDLKINPEAVRALFGAWKAIGGSDNNLPKSLLSQASTNVVPPSIKSGLGTLNI